MAAGQVGMIEIAHLDTAAMPPALARDAYLDAISHTLQTDFPPRDFHARLMSAYLEGVHVIESTVAPRRSERSAALIEKDRYDGICIQLALAGRSIGIAGANKVVSAPGTVMILDFSQPFAMQDEEERHTINFAYPRGAFLTRYDNPRALHGTVIGDGAADLIGSHMQAVTRNLASLPPGSAGKLVEIAMDLALLGLDQKLDEPMTGRTHRRDALAARARRLIDARLGSSDLTPERLMSRLNVSRSDLYAMFDKSGGVSRYIWQRRLEAARAALMDPADPRRIGEIAFAFGFQSDAHFSRAFRRHFGTTPSAARRGLRE